MVGDQVSADLSYARGRAAYEAYSNSLRGPLNDETHEHLFRPDFGDIQPDWQTAWINAAEAVLSVD